MNSKEDLRVTGHLQREITTQPFSLEEGLSPLNDYFSFAPEERKGVIAYLWLATRFLPTADECYYARQNGSVGEMRMENRYGVIADLYAQSVDPKFTKNQINTDSKAAQNRRRFYGMIRTLTAEQVLAGVQKIPKIEAKLQASA